MSTDGLQRFLLAGRNPDGGWGYYPGRSSRLEPTCWALLALRDALPEAGLRTVIERWPSEGGLLLERAGGESNYAFHALGLLVLHAFRAEHADTNARLIRGLQGVSLFRVDGANTSNRQNNTLQGWSWIPATFSWVEPTAWALLALKKFRSVAPAQIESGRLAEAEALLIDRGCVQGGWNYGNSNMFGRELHPYVPTTAIALLALQDRSRADAFHRGVKFLSGSATAEDSAYAMSLAHIALSVLATMSTAFAPDPSLGETLGRQVAITCDLGNQLGAAQSLYALRKYDSHAAFRL